VIHTLDRPPTVHEILLDIDATTRTLSNDHPTKRLLIRCGLAIMELATRLAVFEQPPGAPPVGHA
jgi:hypothetical protein